MDSETLAVLEASYALTYCPVGTPRKPQWEALSKATVAAHPYCAACGTTEGLEVHHEYPVHDWPERELDEHNLIVLCRPCHYRAGHGCDWRARNPYVRADAARMLRRVNDRRYGRDDTPKPKGASMALTPYPPSVSYEAVADLAGYFRGTVSIGTAVHGAWDLSGYGLGLGLPDSALRLAQGPLPTGETAAQIIEQALPRDGMGVGLAVPWGMIAALALQVIQAWLAGRQ